MTRHNKKRNTGLLYEFLVRTVSDALIEGDEKRRDTALAIVREHFKKGTELYKEFRLFHSLVAPTIRSEFVADKILEAAKQASKKCDNSKLEHEKSILIRNINHKLNRGHFYSRRIPEYKIYATVQSLINEWRNDGVSDIVEVAQYEEQLKQWLLTEKNIPTFDRETLKEEADPLVEKLMLKKLNERYRGNLTEEQLDLIKSYIFSEESEENKKKLYENIDVIKNKTIKEIDTYLDSHKGKNEYVESKLAKARELILAENTENITDDTVERFLDVSKLKEEILNKE